MSWYKGLAKAFKEVRFILPSQGISGSDGARGFLRQHFAGLQGQSPRPNVVVRECEGVDGVMVFRYEFGVERKVPLNGLSAAQVEETVQRQMADAERVNKSL